MGTAYIKNKIEYICSRFDDSEIDDFIDDNTITGWVRDWSVSKEIEYQDEFHVNKVRKGIYKSLVSGLSIVKEVKSITVMKGDKNYFDFFIKLNIE